jgi:hypothetical protein
MTEIQRSPAENLRTKAFVERALALSLLVDVVLRVRILVESPVSQSRPVLWLLLGVVQGIAVVAIAAVFCLLLGRVRPRMARRLFAAVVMVRAIVSFIWSEVIVYFGHPPRPLDSEVGFNLSFYTDSLASRSGFDLGVLIVVVGAALVWASVNARRAGKTWNNTPKLLAAAVISAVVIVLPSRIIPETSRDPLLEIARLADKRRAAVMELRKSAAPLRSAADVQRLLPASIRRLARNPDYPFAMSAGVTRSAEMRIPAGLKPNIVFLLLEGMQAEELGSEAGAPPGLTPNLDRLAARGYRAERAYSSGTRTAEGELALWYGALPLPQEWLMADRPHIPLTGLPEILRAVGWRDFVWMYGGDQTFYQRQRFYGLRGFRYFDAADFPGTDVRTSWGFSDLSLSKRSIAVLHSAAEPFAAMLVTISNHHPFRVPSDARTRFDVSPNESLCFGHYTCRMLQTMHYADEAVGDFFARAQKEPWFSRTVFVIGGDHGLPIEPYGVDHPTPHQMEEFLHRIPLIIYSPLLPEGGVFRGPVSQADMLPTLLHLVAPGVPRAGPGLDLFAPAVEDRPIVLWSSQPRMVSVVTATRTYHGVVPSSGGTAGGLEEETLVDSVNDPKGLQNLMAHEPQTAERARAVARAFLDDYPVLVDSGRSGLPPGTLRRATPGARPVAAVANVLAAPGSASR